MKLYFGKLEVEADSLADGLNAAINSVTNQHHKGVDMEYITEEEIEDRMALEGRMSSCPSNRDDLKEITIEELESEHLERIYEVWEQALKDLEDEPNKEEIVLMLLKGWTDDQHITDSEITLGNKVFFNDWEITRCDNQWFFEHCHREGGDFFDVDLLVGLQICEQADRDPDAQRESLIHKFRLNDAQIIQLDRYTRTVAAATKIRAERQMIAEASL